MCGEANQKKGNEGMKSMKILRAILFAVLTSAFLGISYGQDVTPMADTNKTGKVIAGDQAETGYWMTTSSHKRHNQKCRFYKNSKGRICQPDEGIPCKVCGG